MQDYYNIIEKKEVDNSPLVLCISTSKCMLAHAFTWSQTMKNAWKLSKNYFFHHMHERLTQEHEEKCIFLAFRSDYQTLVDTQKLVAPQQFHVNLVIFVREPLVSMIKNTDFNHFSSSLRKINNRNWLSSLRLAVSLVKCRLSPVFPILS